MSQKPPRQSDVQQSAAEAHPLPTGRHAPGGGGGGGFPPVGGGGGGSGASQLPFVQLEVQQSAPVMHGPAAGTQAATPHVCEAGSQCLLQQSASATHVALSPLQRLGGAMQRGGLVLLSQRSLEGVAPQQPFCGPELHVSPVGRHVEFAASIKHFFVAGSQRFEQQSELTAHVSLSTLQMVPPHVPPLQASVQQSCASTHATPSARHASRHWMTPAMPVTGSQSPLQHWLPVVHAVVGPMHATALPAPPSPPPPTSVLPTHLPPLQVPEQQSKPFAQTASAMLQAFAPASPTLPPQVHPTCATSHVRQARPDYVRASSLPMARSTSTLNAIPQWLESTSTWRAAGSRHERQSTMPSERE